VTALRCPHCGQRGESGNPQAFDIRGRIEAKAVVKCMLCGQGFTKSPLGRGKPISNEQWSRMEAAFSEHVSRSFATPAPGDDLFTHAGGLLAALADQNDALYEQDQLLSVACLLASGRALRDLALHGEGPATTYLQAIQSLERLELAGSAVMACSWYFLFTFGQSRIPPEHREEWATGMIEGLAPTSDVQPVDESLIGPLFDAYVSATQDREAVAPFALRFSRWFWLHTSMSDDGEIDGKVVLTSAPQLLQVCQLLLPSFQSDLAAARLA
jgi:hypothetical protein